jgi:pentapeptide MXKDX repeat protein
MKKAILVATCVAALSAFTTTGAFAQSTGPAAQQDTMSKDKMGKESAKKEGVETTGMSNNAMKKDGMKKDMSKDGSPDADTMKKKDGMSK